MEWVDVGFWVGVVIDFDLFGDCFECGGYFVIDVFVNVDVFGGDVDLVGVGEV